MPCRALHPCGAPRWLAALGSDDKSCSGLAVTPAWHSEGAVVRLMPFCGTSATTAVLRALRLSGIPFTAQPRAEYCSRGKDTVGRNPQTSLMFCPGQDGGVAHRERPVPNTAVFFSPLRTLHGPFPQASASPFIRSRWVEPGRLEASGEPSV